MSVIQQIINKAKHLLTKKTTGAVVGLVISFIYFAKVFGKTIPTVKLSYFLLAISQNNISEVFVNGSNILFKGLNSDAWYSTNAAMLTKDRIYKLLKNKPNVVFSCADTDQGKLTPASLLLFSGAFFAGFKLFDLYMDRKTANKSLRENLYTDTTFEDIYGLDTAKQELNEVIDFLKEPEKYKAIGARLRRGILLYGPSGTGKTLLARATAGESKAAFLSCTGSEFMEMYVGVGPKRVRELFEKARSVQPCIIFIDEIDGIGIKRKSQLSGGDMGVGDNERSSTLNQLLTEMDGFRENANIVVIAATNRVNLLDEALLRSGRFDTKLKIDLPSEKERLGIMKVHFRNKKYEVNENTLEKIAKQANGFSGADLENLVNESAYICIQHHNATIVDKDVEDSYQKVMSQKKLA